MSNPPVITNLAYISQSDFDKICDALEAEIVRLENIDYASPEARDLLDLEAEIVARWNAAAQ